MSINVNDKNLGHATAYAYYKAGGGTMTEAEFTEFMADFGTASQTAVEAAQAALASKNAAQTAATTATNKATEATTAATTATTKAGEASTSASTATSAKDTAVSAASTATTKATEATTAAATAVSAKDNAVSANTAAQSAKTAAQTAQTGAETAAASVEASAAQIATNAEDISQLKSDLTQIVYTPVLRNGSAVNPDNATGITQLNVIPLRTAIGAWVTINIPLTGDRYFHVNLDAYSVESGLSSDMGNRVGGADPYITATDTFYISFENIFTQYNAKSIVLSVFEKDGNNNVPLRVEEIGNAITIQYDFESIASKKNMVFIKNAVDGAQTFDMYVPFMRGGLSNGNITPNLYRMCSRNTVNFDKDITITAHEGYRFGIHSFSSGVYASDSGWQTVYTIPQNTEFMIVISKIPPESAIDLKDVYDFVRRVTFTYSNSKKISVPWESDMHRGYSSPTVHENTIPAFYRAWKNGATMIEVDARLSSDGIYVSNHDATITVGGTTYTIANETADSLTHLVLSTDATYGDCCIPLLETVLNLCCYTGMKANVDCKQINPTTLAKLVVDCGMSGKVMYANTSIANAQTILATDPNAGFIFEYSEEGLSAWATALTEYHTRQRSYAWSPNVSYDALEKTRSYGFKYLLAGVTTTALMSYAPDCVEFEATANCKALNDTYINSLSFVP